MGAYLDAVTTARAARCPHVELRVAGPWYDLASFTTVLASRLASTLEQLQAAERNLVPVLLTSDSPLWRFAYRRAGHTPSRG